MGRGSLLSWGTGLVRRLQGMWKRLLWWLLPSQTRKPLPFRYYVVPFWLLVCGGEGYKNYGEKPEMHEGEVPWVPLVSTETWDLGRMANFPPSFQDEVLNSGYRIQDTGYRVQDTGFLVLRKEGRTRAR